MLIKRILTLLTSLLLLLTSPLLLLTSPLLLTLRLQRYHSRTVAKRDPGTTSELTYRPNPALNSTLSLTPSKKRSLSTVANSALRTGRRSCLEGGRKGSLTTTTSPSSSSSPLTLNTLLTCALPIEYRELTV